MCTIMTLDQKFYFTNKQQVLARIQSDAAYNSEGWSLLGIDVRVPENDFKFNSMRYNQLANMIDNFFANSSSLGRIFLHARAATTSNVGIAYTHGFDNGLGTIIMHNGIISNHRKLAVDSFNLTSMPDEASSLLEVLEASGETFANVFLITPDLQEYGIVRLLTGSLYTDGEGNYSTNPIGDISQPVPKYSSAAHSLDREAEEQTMFELLEQADREYEASLREQEQYASWDSYEDSYYKRVKKLG